MQHIGKNIKRVIDESKMKQKEIAASLGNEGISLQHLHNLFGKENVDTKYLFQLSDILKVPVTSFFDEGSVGSLESDKELKAEIEKLRLVNDNNIQRIKELQESVEDKKSIINLTYSQVLTALKSYAEFADQLKSDNGKLLDEKSEFFKKYESIVIQPLRLIIKSSEQLNKVYDLTSFLNETETV